MGIFVRLRLETLLAIREQETALLNDPSFAIDHPAIHETLIRLDAELERREIVKLSQGEKAPSCPNPWHGSAPARQHQACPECETGYGIFLLLRIVNRDGHIWLRCIHADCKWAERFNFSEPVYQQGNGQILEHGLYHLTTVHDTGVISPT